MKKIVTLASHVRATTLLCCSAAVLLSACGGGTSDSPTTTAAMVESTNASEATVATGAQTPALTEQSTASGAFQTSSTPAADAQAPRLLATVTSVSVSDQITELYRTLLKREPDSAGLQYWVNAVNAGYPMSGVQSSLTSSAEYQSLQAATTTPSTSSTTTSIYHLYVSPTGSDSNTGSSSSPFKTITKAASVAKAGTTVHVAPGTYYGNVATKTSGTSTNPIIFLSNTTWGAKIVGSGTEAMWTNNGNYVQIVGFDISGPGRLGILNYASNTLVKGNHIHNLTLSGGCTGSGGAGVVNATYTGSNGDVIGNVVNDIGKPGGCNGVQGIYSSNAGGKIMNNIVYRVSAYGIHLWHAASGTIIANNTVFANGSSGMGGGIVTGVGDSPGGVQLVNTKVVNNIVYNNPRAGILQYCYSGVNCIGSGNVVANNLVYGNGSAITMKVGSATGTVSADPKFVSYYPTGTGDYRLQSTSPAINRGTSSYAPTTDFLGVARPKGGAFDIGAYESY